MANDRMNAISRQLNFLIQRQLETVQNQNFLCLTDPELRDYEFRFLRIKALCQDLEREEGRERTHAAGA